MKRTFGKTGRCKALAVVAGASMALTACGSNATASKSPTQALESATAALGKSSSVSVRASLDLSPSQLAQLAKQSNSKLTQGQLRAISEGAIYFEEATGHGEPLDSAKARTDPDNSYDVGLSIGSTSPIEFRYVSQNIYLRLDLVQLASELQRPLSGLSGLESQAAKINAVIPGVSALLAGSWVEISHASLAPLLSLAKTFASSSGSPAPSGASTSKLASELAAALKSNTTITSAGSSGGRQVYDVTIRVKQFAEDYVKDLNAFLSSLPAGTGSKEAQSLGTEVSKIPANQTAKLTAYTSGGRLVEVTLDLNQFAPQSSKMPFNVPLELQFGTAPAISAPSGATMVDLSKLPSLLQNLGSLSG